MKSNLLTGLILFAIIGCKKNHEDVSLNTSLGNERASITSNITEPLQYSFEQLDNTKGLSNSSVNTIFQDSEDLLWIGTWDGLNRYDGNHFKTFRPELNNEHSLTNQVILKIDEDKWGYIWVLTIHGLNKYDKKSNTFTRYFFSRDDKPPLTESEFNMALGHGELFQSVGHQDSKTGSEIQVR